MFDRKASQQRWRESNPNYHRDYNRRRRLDGYRKEPEYYQHLWRKYRLTPEQYADMLAKQNGVCAFCSKDNGGRRLCVDHDHTKQKGEGNRWLLCTKCNLIIGYAADDPAFLRLVADKLDEYHGRSSNSFGFYSRGQDFAFGSSATLSLPG